MDILIEPPLPRSKSLSALPSTARTGDRSVTAQTSSTDGLDVPRAGIGSMGVYEGKKVVVIRGKGKRMVKAYAVFPTGPVGESLSELYDECSVISADSRHLPLSRLGTDEVFDKRRDIAIRSRLTASCHLPHPHFTNCPIPCIVQRLRLG